MEPVLALKARVAQVKELPAGACISYGCTATTQRPSKIAAVTAEYADAYPRGLSNKGAYAVIGGVKCPKGLVQATGTAGGHDWYHMTLLLFMKFFHVDTVAACTVA